MPPWETHVLCSLFARCLQGGGVYVSSGTVTISSCTISGNTAVSVRARARALMIKSSHCPDGRLMFCSLFAGRRCLRLFRHGHDNVFLDHRQHSLLCACSCSKVPIAPMGNLLTCLPRLSLTQLRPMLRSTTECMCCRDLENFPMPPWDTHVLLVVCREAVSMSIPARSR